MEHNQGQKYSALQIALHWAVVLMIGAQWASSGAIHRTHNPLKPPADIDLLLHAFHNYCGMAIGAAILLRVALRLHRGQPQLRPRTPAEAAAAAVHWGIYASIAAQAATGFVTAYFWAPAGAIHVLLWNLTLALVAIHVAAAAWHAIRRDGVAGRMVPFGSAARHARGPR